MQVAANVVQKELKDVCRSLDGWHIEGAIDTCMHKESSFVSSVYLLFLRQKKRRGDR